MASIRFSDVDWTCYAPGMQHLVQLALTRGQRVLTRCLVCRTPKATVHVYLPPETETLGGGGIAPVPYGLCAKHADISISTIAAALGLSHTLEKNHGP